MTTIKASCAVCGDVSLTPTDVRLVVCSNETWSYYAFNCPDCTDEVRKPADEEIIALLISGGVDVTAVAHPGRGARGPRRRRDQLRRAARLRPLARRARPAHRRAGAHGRRARTDLSSHPRPAHAPPVTSMAAPDDLRCGHRCRALPAGPRRRRTAAYDRRRSRTRPDPGAPSPNGRPTCVRNLEGWDCRRPGRRRRPSVRHQEAPRRRPRPRPLAAHLQVRDEEHAGRRRRPTTTAEQAAPKPLPASQPTAPTADRAGLDRRRCRPRDAAARRRLTQPRPTALSRHPRPVADQRRRRGSAAGARAASRRRTDAARRPPARAAQPPLQVGARDRRRSASLGWIFYDQIFDVLREPFDDYQEQASRARPDRRS